MSVNSVSNVTGEIKNNSSVENSNEYTSKNLKSIFDKAREERLRQLDSANRAALVRGERLEKGYVDVPKIYIKGMQETDAPEFQNAERSNSKNPKAAALVNLINAKFGNKFDVRISGDMLLLAPKKSTSNEDRKVGEVRDTLGIKPGVVSDNNGVGATGRSKIYDFATIDDGHYLQIPISALGQDVNNGFLGIGSNKDEMAQLQKAAKEYKDSISE